MSERRTVITKDTAVSVGVLATLAGLFVGALVWTNADTRWKTRQEAATASMIGDLQALKTAVRDAGKDRWYRSEMIEWAADLTARNPDLNVPKVHPRPED